MKWVCPWERGINRRIANRVQNISLEWGWEVYRHKCWACELEMVTLTAAVGGKTWGEERKGSACKEKNVVLGRLRLRCFRFLTVTGGRESFVFRTLDDVFLSWKQNYVFVVWCPSNKQKNVFLKFDSYRWKKSYNFSPWNNWFYDGLLVF